MMNDTPMLSTATRGYGSIMLDALKISALLWGCMGLSGCASLTMERQQTFSVQTYHGGGQTLGDRM